MSGLLSGMGAYRLAAYNLEAHSLAASNLGASSPGAYSLGARIVEPNLHLSFHQVKADFNLSGGCFPILYGIFLQNYVNKYVCYSILIEFDYR